MRNDGKRLWNALFFLALFALIFLHSTANSELTVPAQNIITVCDGEAASFSWPCDLAYDLAKIMTLTFKGLSKEGQVVAIIDNTGKVNVSGGYSNRVVARGTSGVRLDNVGILDSGMYITTATFANGTVIEKRFSLNVQVPPLLVKNQLEVSVRSTRPKCQEVTCGKVLFPGFPPVSFSWQTPKGAQSQHLSSGGTSSLQGCSLASGNYTCRVTGPALACRKHYPGSAAAASSASIILSAQAVTGKTVDVAKQERQELILMIVVPIIAVMTPLVILGVWLLSHLFSGWSCNSDDSDESLLESASSLPPAVQFSLSALVSTSSASPEEAPVSSGEPDVEEKDKGEGVGEEEEEAEVAVDLDVADPTVPLMDQDTFPSINLENDSDGSETKL